MSAIHGVLGLATLAIAVALLATTTVSAIVGPRLPAAARAWLVDGLALVAETVAAVTALGGPLLLASGHQPTEILHLVYGVVALVVLPVGLGVAMARHASGPRRDRWLAVASFVLVGVAFRLVQTG